MEMNELTQYIHQEIQSAQQDQVPRFLDAENQSQ